MAASAGSPPAEATATPSRGTTTTTGPPAASAARSATAPRPSPVSTASSICRCTARRRSTSDAAAGGDMSGRPVVIRLLRRGLSGHLGMGLQGLLAGLAGADPVGLLDRHDEHLPVADLARAGVLEDRVHDRLHVLGGHDALELDLRPQPVGQLGAAIALR